MSGYLRKMAVDGYVINLEIPELAECAQLMRYAQKLGREIIVIDPITRAVSNR